MNQPNDICRGNTVLPCSQRIPANVKEALIFDINDDGLNEVVLALTDRVVRSYQWQGTGEGQGQLVPMNKWEFALQVIIVLIHIQRNSLYGRHILYGRSELKTYLRSDRSPGTSTGTAPPR